MINTLGERRPLTKDTKNHEISYKHRDHDISLKMNQQQMYYIEMAKIEALKSTMQHKHGCVVVKRNKIVSIAHNIVQKGHTHSIHAEVNALKKFKHFSKKIMKDCEMYVVRVCDTTISTTLKYSKPCIKCENCIKTHGIGKTFYSISH